MVKKRLKKTVSEPFKIIFLNQMAGPLFRELAEDLSEKWHPCLLFTGHPHTVIGESKNGLRVVPGPVYDRTNLFTRSFSWIKYFVLCISLLNRHRGNALCFIVSNPPFLGLAGLLFRIFRGQPYVMLVYDIYPDILVGTRRIKYGLFSKCWDLLNKMVYRHAARVITIANDMAGRIEDKLGRTSRHGVDIPVVLPWADVVRIKPLAKADNWFAKAHHLANQTVVLYSGNMGHTHDIETILGAAERLADEPRIHFLFIGEGAKWPLIEESRKRNRLRNVTLLPFQPEEVLPFSISAGDIGIVAYQKGSEGCMLPSKACYYMAAGLAPILISDCETDLSQVVAEHSCGVWIKRGNSDRLVKAIRNLHHNPETLNRYKLAARKTAEALFSRRNTAQFMNILQNSTVHVNEAESV